MRTIILTTSMYGVNCATKWEISFLIKWNAILAGQGLRAQRFGLRDLNLVLSQARKSLQMWL